MEAIMKWFLGRFVEGWALIEYVGTWANENVLAAIFFGYILREAARYGVKKTPTKYDDIGFEIIEDAVGKAFAKVQEVRAKIVVPSKKGK